MLRRQRHSNGAVELRRPQADHAAVLTAARDDAFHRWLGPARTPRTLPPASSPASKLPDEFDYDRDPDHDWLGDSEVNIGYFVFAEHRGNGYTTRTVEILLQHLARDTQYAMATSLLDQDNEMSLTVARRCRFEEQAGLGCKRYSTPPVT